MRAKIVQAVEGAQFGEVEAVSLLPNPAPIMELEDGRRFTANGCDRFIAEDTEGTAQYDVNSNVWIFTPDLGPEPMDADEMAARIKQAPDLES